MIRFPHISNFDDFDPLRAEQDVRVRFVDRIEALGQPDLIILPGTKTTVADLAFLRERGLANRIVELARGGVPTLGICGGYQMLGRSIHDPHHVESDQIKVQGLCLLPLTTTFGVEKSTVRARGRILADRGLFANAGDLEVVGYEIHMGGTILQQEGAEEQPEAIAGTRRATSPLLRVVARGEAAAADFDGAVSVDGMVAGTYFHGWFENDAPRHALLTNLAARKGLTRSGAGTHFDRKTEYDRLAAVVRAHLDLREVYRIIGVSQ